MRYVQLASTAFSLEGLSFRQGNAESLPFRRHSFDVVVNVESSHLYPRRQRFFREVSRILRPKGYFLFADLGRKRLMEQLPDQLREAGFAILHSWEITKNVIKSIELDNARRERIVRSVSEDEEGFRDLARWARLVGTEGYQAYCDGRHQYWSYILQKR